MELISYLVDFIFTVHLKYWNASLNPESLLNLKSWENMMDPLVMLMLCVHVAAAMSHFTN